jgi:hypothetical protein
MLDIPIINIRFNPIYRNILTVAYGDGLVDFISLSEDYYKTSYYDLDKFKENIIKLSNMKI